MREAMCKYAVRTLTNGQEELDDPFELKIPRLPIIRVMGREVWIEEKRVRFGLTRFARALREIGLAAGEPPTRRGFPPSVFATLPRLMERVGMNDKGSITALYTVLVEGDDMTEPIADETRSILDGHIVLSRALAAANHYPAIDVLASASRVQNHVITPEHKAAAGRMRELMAKYNEVELLVKIGEYKRGSDAVTDEAIDKVEAIRGFLRQRTDEHSGFAQALEDVVIKTVESGQMTKDLSMLVGGDQGYLTTEEFLGALDVNLQKAMAAK